MDCIPAKCHTQNFSASHRRDQSRAEGRRGNCKVTLKCKDALIFCRERGISFCPTNTFILLVVTGYDVKGEKNDSYFRKEKSSFPNHLCETPHPGLREQATCCETYKKELAFSLSIFY